MLLAGRDQPVEIVGGQEMRRALLLHPAAMAAQVAGIGERDEGEGRVELAAAQAPLVRPHGLGALQAVEMRGLEKHPRRQLAKGTPAHLGEECLLPEK